MVTEAYSNSSAMPIPKLPDCTDWLTNIRAFLKWLLVLHMIEYITIL